MTRLTLVRAAAVVLILSGVPAAASNSLIRADIAVAVAKSTLMVTPAGEWNKMGARPGRNSETWTLDGDGLNDLTFYGGIQDDRPLFREVAKRTTPLPRFSATMLLTDIPALVEASYRVALGTALMTIDGAEPTMMSGNKAILFRYRFTRQGEEVARKGEAVAAIVSGKLYMISFEAPAIHYFDRDVARFRAIARSARIG